MTAKPNTAEDQHDAATQRIVHAERDAERLAAFNRAKRHSARVRFLKWSLPMLAATIVVTFVGYSFLSMPGTVSFDLGETVLADGKLVMANPKLEGFTNNRPYTMTAARALQDPANIDVVELEGIDAKVPVDADNWANIDAAKGVYDRKRNTLNITEPMTITTTDGKKILLQSAFVNVKSGALNTRQPVDISMDGLRLSANTMRVQDNGKVLIFVSRVRMTIEAGRMKTAAAENGDLNAQN